MSDDDRALDVWHKHASRGDLLSAVVFLRSEITALAAVITAMRMGDESEAQDRMKSYFDSHKKLNSVIDEIGEGTI